MSVLARYWGKARSPESGDLPFHAFACHSLDVIVSGDSWLDGSPVLTRSLYAGHDPRVMRSWIRFFLGLHDLGKLDQRFQAKAPDVLRWLAPDHADRLARVPASFTHYDHGQMGYRWALSELHAYVGLEADDDAVHSYWDAWQPWLAAVTGHHGSLPRDGDPPPAFVIPQPLREADRQARTEWVRTLEKLCLIPEGQSLRDMPPPAPPLLPGFCAVADWLGSNTDYFPYCEQPADLRRYLSERAQRAQSVLRASGLLSQPADRGGMAALFPERMPRQIQTVIDDLPRVPGLVLIEGPTASGKTEGALAYASHLLSAGLAESIVFALPTQATANAMLRRIEAVAPRLFNGGQTNLVLAHGKSRYNPEFIELRKAVHPLTAQQRDEALVQCADWLSQSRKRAFLGQIGVCTIDQVLLSVLPVRHNFVRGLGMGRSVLIVDEVHAYDSYMYGLLEDVLRRQKAAGASTVLLSATLPHAQRSRLVRAWGAESDVEPFASYPLLTHVDCHGRVTPFCPPKEHQPDPRSVIVERVTLAHAFPNDDLCARILDAARAGARVAVVCNLVDHAQRLARLLRQMADDVPVDLFHARYRFCDRLIREQAVMRWYGAERAADGGRVLVATQVVEQSLDLDFDWLVTQLCPVDLLFQRLGRLHRHLHERPRGFEAPRVCVLLPEESDFGAHSRIYENVRVLWRTLQLLEFASQIAFPAAYRQWIEKVYDVEDWSEEPERILAAADAWREKQRAARYEAQRLASGEVTVYSDDDARIQIYTRDGEMSLTVLPTVDGALLDGRTLRGFEAWELREVIDQHAVAVPASWKKFLPAPEEGVHRLPMTKVEDGWVTNVGTVRLVYTNEYGMEKQSQ